MTLQHYGGKLIKDGLSLLKQQSSNPYRTIAFMFFIVMVAGALLLMLPIATKDGTSTGFIDALFTSVSAVAITGLTVVDTYQHWSIFGQLVIVILIQLGGLGILTFATIVAVILGRRIGVQERLNLQASIDESSFQGLVCLVLRIVKTTFFIEGLGAILFMVQLYPYFGEDTWYYAIFQSISLFCNAGFVFFDSLFVYEMVDNTFFTLISTGLIIIGGIGYTVIFDVCKKWRQPFHRFTLQSKIMLLSTAGLIIFATLFIFLFEMDNPLTLAPLSMVGKWDAAFLQAVTPRTAGMATLDYTNMHVNTVLLTIGLMFLGGGPSSTAGGIKLTTAVVLFVSSLSICRGHKEVRIFDRTLSSELQHRAMASVLFAILLMGMGVFLIATFDVAPVLAIIFEVTSAFANVGLSMNLTASLSDASKVVLIFLMFAGRVGVMTLIASLIMKHRKRSHVRYPYEDIML